MGLCGEIHNFDFAVTHNYQVESFSGSGWAELVVGDSFPNADLLNIHLDQRWEKCVLNEHIYRRDLPPVVSKLRDYVPRWVPMMVRYAPRLRWFAQRNFNTRRITSRNELLYPTTKHFDFRKRGKPIWDLFELFVPTHRAADFVRSARKYILKFEHVYNTTVRDIQESQAIMRYSKGPTRGFVTMIRKHENNAELIRELIDVALDHGGTYYLPYDMHATVSQFRLGYPRWEYFKSFVVPSMQTEWSKKYLGII